MTELVVRGALVVTPESVKPADIAIEDGVISAIGPELAGAILEIDARGLIAFPGLIDVHVHFDEPGHTEWEGAATGSRALAAGGGTLFFDMPLNSIPCTVNGREFDRKRLALEQSSITDFALWGGLVPGNIQEMAELAERGVVGFKAFLCHSGLDEFPRVDDLTLWEGLSEAARLGLPVAVHAENHEIVTALSRRMSREGRQSVRDFLDSRPVIAELEAIQRATLLAADAGAKLHVIHISSGRGVSLAAQARARGVDVSIETCPHYLFFTDDDVERLGAIAKCAPPVRDKQEQNKLWSELLHGNVDVVASDHSPVSPERKAGDFWRAWGGIAGVQSTPARAAVIEKPYIELAGTPPPRLFTGRESLVEAESLDGDPWLEVRHLVPDNPAFDVAVNTMTFQPGAALPLVESHVMEHGLLMLSGGGIYRLGDRWYPVKAGDFIWMAPYCPQWFGALGKTAAKYLIYKDWNRY